MHIQEIFCDSCGSENFTKICQDLNQFYVPYGTLVNHVGSQNRSKNNSYFNFIILVGDNIHILHGEAKTIRICHQEIICMGNSRWTSSNLKKKKSSLKQLMSKFISSTETRLQNQDVSIMGLKNQIGLLVKIITNTELAPCQATLKQILRSK